MKIAPSMLACDFINIGEEIKRVEQSGADMLHLDIMDGHFVPNISFGPMVVEQMRKRTRIPFDVHLMVSNPLFYLEHFAKAGADIITFHVESESDINKTIDKIHSYGIKAGISIKPDTPVDYIIENIRNVDLVLIMTVEPGFGGQTFLLNQIPKIKFLKNFINKENLKTMIEVDGGINKETSQFCKEVGADICVAGTSVFKYEDMSFAINQLK